MRHSLSIAAKDLRSDIRAKEIAPAMIMFALILVFLFTFAFPPGAGRAPPPPPLAGAVASREVAAVLLWAGLLFAAIIGFGRSAALEKEGDRIEGLLMSPVDTMAIFTGKAIANFVFLCLMEAVMIPAFIVFFDVSPGLMFPGMFPVLILANAGLSATGTLFAASSQYSRVRELVLALLAFPILLPLVLGASKLTSALLLTGGFGGEGRWFILMASFDLAVTAIGVVTFEYVIHE